MQSGIDPRVDYAFRRVFGSENTPGPLIDLLNAVLTLPAGKPVRAVQLTNPFTEKDFADEKVSVLDVKARDPAGRQFHLEMQRIVPWQLGKRALYYWAELHTEQLVVGDYHQTLCPTYTICFLDGPFLKEAPYHHRFQAVDLADGALLCKDLEIHTIELSKFDLTAEQVHTSLERWCFFLKHGESLDSDNLPSNLDTPAIRQALEVLNMLSQSEIERHRYQSRRKTERDEASLRYAAEHAREEGLEEGLDQGALIGRVQLAQRLLKVPVSTREELIALEQETLAQLADQLEQQLVGGLNGSK